MTAHMTNEIQKLKSKLLFLCSLVEQSLWKAVKSLRQRDGQLARQVIDEDEVIDQNEVDVEEECLKILALHQPVAIDLRFIVTALKINDDLERIGDLSVNIAERSEFLARHDSVPNPFDFDTMARITQQMLRDSLDALVNTDCTLALKVLKDDDHVDAINKEMYDQVKQAILDHPEYIESLIHLLSVSRHLERIADHAVNIAENVIYMVEGRIIRHKTEEYQ
jgi:phosphate transport system protein